jgi:hypothetical protein
MKRPVRPLTVAPIDAARNEDRPMRTALLLLLAMLAVQTTGTTGAMAQDACSKPYVACIDKCVARPSKSLQDTCMEACQTQNNACFSNVFGGPGPGVQTVREATDQPDNAVAAQAEQPAAKAAASAKPAGKPQQSAAKPQQPAQRRAQ